jgi:hypothetical protein
MIKKIGLVVALVAVGVAIAFYLRGGLGPVQTADTFTPQTDASADVRIADLERALAGQIDRARTLEARVAQLEGRTVAPGGQFAGRGPGEHAEERAARVAELRGRFGEDGQLDAAAMRERLRERDLARFVEAGFTRERAEWIERRAEELEVQAMQAQYEAQRSGQPVQGQMDTQRALRAELGDAEYERYLTATGRPTQVQVMDVLASSNAERAGLQAGDQIVSYAGSRVFDVRELNALTREGSGGESVTVEVRRNGQTVQVQVPRGPLGVSSGAVRGGGPGGGGGPPGGGGGFRGGR